MQTPLKKTSYQKINTSNTTYLAYVVALQNPLNIHLQIYWPQDVELKYRSCCKYTYEYVSEELGNDIHEGFVYSCHLKGIEIIQNVNGVSNMKEAYVFISKRISQLLGWFLVSVSDIDVYSRILINMFDIITRKSINKEILEIKNPHTELFIAREYNRPNKQVFLPKFNQNSYNIEYNSDDNINIIK